MKKTIILSVVITGLILIPTWGAEELSYQQNAMFRICADSGDFVQGTIDMASAININSRAQLLSKTLYQHLLFAQDFIYLEGDPFFPRSQD